MNDRLLIRALWIAAAIALASGALLTAYSLRQRERVFMLTNDALYSGRELRTLEQAAVRADAAQKMFEQQSFGPRIPLSEQIKEAFPGFKADDIRETVAPSIPGWTVRRSEVSLDDAPLDAVMAFVSKVSTQRPPWSLVGCTIRSSSRPGGRGRVALILEAVERTK